ncbi:MAG: mechanosensitive ion channel family protein [Candidatus Thermoplasmatota archaeon]|nr:mechanosensitive ion channel family protein [Candidatus Thermoplasmatota archaeon]MBS3790715.1 mechanosensitive ion channel family protein [Candidatus Thermoplasmatota archaeon]
MFDRVLYGGVTISDLLISITILLAAVIIGKAISLRIRHSLRDKVSKDRLNIVSKIVYFSFLIIGFLIVLPLLEFNISGFLVAGGILGIIIGFASQSIVTNLISGVFLTFERPFRVDDVVKLGGESGTLGVVEDIKIISTTMRTFEGVYVRVPNEKVFTGNIINYLENVARRFEYNVGIRYKDDADEAMRLINELIEEQPMALKEPEPQVFVESLGSSAVELKVRVWAPSTEWFPLRMELLWKIKKELEENGIQVPFNQQEVWFKNPLQMDEDKIS